MAFSGNFRIGKHYRKPYSIQPDKKSYARYYQNELKRELEEMENGKQGAGIDRKNYR